MPGRYYLTDPVAGLDNPPRRNIAPGEEVAVITKAGPRLMRWGLIPNGRVNARGRPVLETIINVRSETIFDKSAFEGLRRAVVPASGWYEWTGQKGRKQPWRISRKDGVQILFAAVFDVWKAPGGQEVPQVATVTCPPSADVIDIHHRMGFILELSDVPTWLDADESKASTLLKPFPDGRLFVEKADDVDWNST
ncbi:SOS response-associated peptidase [Yoonia litorea]|uniref:Abasic site processing protein n=1 Tax=Yoonia litorea TaxID=1123755 RepID=A0A1I6N125_9RHOB|nr:SOS response-associated peptidase [Yoonia litorea]SFS21665.1 Putative SOS response-associated peptidase YedK [Yoonia litorea]